MLQLLGATSCKLIALLWMVVVAAFSIAVLSKLTMLSTSYWESLGTSSSRSSDRMCIEGTGVIESEVKLKKA